ncbi:hypothetical protein H4Q26_000230 [Puccinia striiformis f. sp. tritici PST-130]|nr:hypothetical protein H4Q26_000230 [Puccinia striiformis f. sp. tritici PST-130]
MNTRPATLLYLGDNFADWKACVDWTLRHAFCLTKSWFKADDNFETLKPEEKLSVAALLRNTVVEALFKLIEHMDEPAQYGNSSPLDVLIRIVVASSPSLTNLLD